MNIADQAKIEACFLESDLHEAAQIRPLKKAGAIMCRLIKETTGLKMFYTLSTYDTPMDTVVIWPLHDDEARNGFCCSDAIEAWKDKYLPRRIQFWPGSACFWFLCYGHNDVNDDRRCTICARANLNIPWQKCDEDFQRQPRVVEEDVGDST